MKVKTVVYVAGKYRDRNAWELEKNIRKAEELAFSVAAMGLIPLCPHTNTRFFDGTFSHEYWLAATLELMRRCDAVLVADNWEDSPGTIGEIKEARALGIPVLFDVMELEAWTKKKRSSSRRSSSD